MKRKVGPRGCEGWLIFDGDEGKKNLKHGKMKRFQGAEIPREIAVTGLTYHSGCTWGAEGVCK